MKSVKTIFFTILLLLVGAVSSFGQLKFHVASFGEDQFDLAARDERFKKIDGSGSLYAIIKVSGDDLKEYMFDFGNMNHLVEELNGKLWVYVQKNAKMVTIMRKGYTTIDKYDLHTTIEAGKTYVMQLSAQGPVIYTQMVMFQVKPVDARATIMIRQEGADAQEEVFGITDAEGRVANPLEYGTYTYRVMSTNYHSTEGRITLNNQDETHVENVSLRSNGAVITLSVAQDAEIYVNGARKGVRSWKGLLKAGNYQVECRQPNHRPSSQNITVTEGKDEVVTLTSPTPITGRLSVNSSPLNATIKVGGRVLGNTPKIIPDMLIGRHEIVLSREGYDDASATVDVKEGEISNVNLTLKEKPKQMASSIGDMNEEDEPIYDVVSQNAQFPGGDAACTNWLRENVEYPSDCVKDGVQGRVIVSFVVNIDGTIENAKVMRSPDQNLSNEALRVVKAMPKWKPARLDGRVVRSRFNLPIMFRLPNQ